MDRRAQLEGLAHIRYLLFHPDEKVHVANLGMLGEQRSSAFPSAEVGSVGRHQLLHGDADSGDVLDVRARREYRARLVDLRAELDEALHWKRASVRLPSAARSMFSPRSSGKPSAATATRER